MKLRYIFAAVYILVDILYVGFSRDVYNVATKQIQGTGMANRLWAALAAYTCMVLGWFFLAAPAAERATSLISAIGVGIVYGLLVIGTFNFTLHAMLTNWAGYIMIRDLMWGITWSTVVTVMYYIINKK